jgi:hypothetical protein
MPSLPTNYILLGIVGWITAGDQGRRDKAISWAYFESRLRFFRTRRL